MYKLGTHGTLLIVSLERDGGRTRARICRLPHDLCAHVALDGDFGTGTGSVRLFAANFGHVVAKGKISQLTSARGRQTCISVCDGHCSSLNGDFIVRQQIPNSAQLERTLRSAQPGRCLECVPDIHTEAEVLENTGQTALPGCKDSIPVGVLVRP